MVHETVRVVHETVKFEFVIKVVHETVKSMVHGTVKFKFVVHETVMVHETVEDGARDGHYFRQIFLFLLVDKSWHVAAYARLCGRAGSTSSTLLGSMGIGGGGQAGDLSAFFWIFRKLLKIKLFKHLPRSQFRTFDLLEGVCIVIY
jgi:hypothetical protein